jgi:chromosome segregation ATPase
MSDDAPAPETDVASSIAANGAVLQSSLPNIHGGSWAGSAGGDDDDLWGGSSGAVAVISAGTGVGGGKNQALVNAKKEASSLRHRLIRRGFLLDTIRKAYLRDVVVIAEELRRKKHQGNRYEPSATLDSMPMLDLQDCLMLFAPTEAALSIKPCVTCGGTMELIHLETQKVAELEAQVAALKKTEIELKAEVENYKALLMREQDTVKNERQLAKEEQGYFLQEIATLKKRIAEDDAPGLRAKLKGLDRTEKELDEAKKKLKVLDRTQYMLEDAKEQIATNQREIAVQKTQLHEAEAEIKVQEEKVKDQQETIVKVNKMVNELKDAISEMKIEYKKMKKEVKQAEKDCARKQEALEKARKAEADAKEQCMQIKAECDEKVEDLEKELDVLQQKCDLMREAEADMKRKVKSLQKQLTKAEDDLERQKEEFEKKRLEDAEKAKKKREDQKKRHKAVAKEDDMDLMDFSVDLDMGGDMSAAPPPMATAVVEDDLMTLPPELTSAPAPAPAPAAPGQAPPPMMAPLVGGGGGAAMAAENGRLKGELATMDRKCKELVARMQQIHAKYKASQEENAELESALEESEVRVQQFKKEVDKEKGKVKAIQETLVKLEEKITMLEDEKFLLMRRAKGAGAGAQELQAKLDEETKMRRKLERDLAAMEKEMKITRRLRNGLQNLVTQCCMGMEAFLPESPTSKEVDTKCKEIKGSEKDGALKLEVWQKHVKITEKIFHTKLNEINKLLSESKSKNVVLEEAKQAMLAKIGGLEKQISNLGAEKSKLREEKDALEVRLKNTQKAAAEMEEGLRKKLRKLDENLTSKEEECEEHKRKLKKAADGLAKATQDRTVLSRKLADMTRKHKQVEAAKSILEIELEKALQELKGTKSLLASTEVSIVAIVWPILLLSCAVVPGGSMYHAHDHHPTLVAHDHHPTLAHPQDELTKITAERNGLAAKLQSIYDDEAAKIAARRDKEVCPSSLSSLSSLSRPSR